MKTLELQYVDFLQHNIMLLNKEFNEGYELYNQKHPQELEYEFYYDEELAHSMVSLLQQGNHFQCPEYETLDNLYGYIQMLLYFDKKERLKYQGDNLIRLLNEPNEYLNELSNYSLDDSLLVKFKIFEDICTFFFHNALISGDNRDDEDYIIKGDNIEFHFEGVRDMKFSGSFDLKYLEHSRVYQWEHDKVSGGLYRLAILCIASYEHFIIEFTFSTVCAKRLIMRLFELSFKGKASIILKRLNFDNVLSEFLVLSDIGHRVLFLKFIGYTEIHAFVVIRYKNSLKNQS